MPTFEFTAPGGQKFSVQGPEGATPEQAFQVLQQRMGGQAAPAAAPDKYQAAAQEELASDKAKGIPLPSAIQRRLLQGATFNFADELLAGAATPIEMIKRGTFSPIEGYNYAKARADANLEDARKESGALGTAAEIGGGVLSGLGLARGGVGLMSRLAPEAGLGARSLASAADAAAYGTVAGAGEGNDIAERAKHAAIGGAGGLVLGGAAPAALSVAGSALSPIASNIAARINPAGYAQRQLARALQESGQSPQQIADSVSSAAAEGQPMFTVADAMGNSGQRMLSTVTKAPGEGRTSAVDFLNARQAGQGGRLSEQVDQAFGTSGTARKTADQLIAKANKDSAPFYESSLSEKPVWSERLQQFFDDPITKRGLKEGVEVQRLEALAAGKKFDPKDYAIIGFNDAGDPIMGSVPNMRTVNLVKKGFDNILEGYRDSTTQRLSLDERGRAIDAVRRSFLKEIDSLNPDYAKARQLYAGPAQVRDAISLGAAAPTRGRAADNIARFDAMSEPQKQGFRTGYGDKLAASFERGAEGVNKVRPLTSDKSQAELGALSLYNGPYRPGGIDPLARQFSRENTMFQTRNEALGNSKTAENLADANALGIDPSIVGKILHGNWMGAARSLLSSASNAASGNTSAVRQEVGRLLMMRGGNVTQQQLQDLLSQAIQMAQVRQTVANRGITGLAAGAALAPSANSRP